MNQRSKNSALKLAKQQESQKQAMLVNSSEQERYAMLMEEALRRIANNLPDQDLSQDPGYQELSQERPKLACALNLEVSSPLYGTAWIRVSRGGTQWARQSSEFTPDEWRNRCRPGPPRRPRSVHRGTDCFPVTISARKRHIRTARNSHW